MQAKYPLIFGEHGGSSRVFSMTEVAYSLGMMLGPLLSGILFEAIGFYLMSVVFGTCYHLQHTEYIGLIALAAMCIILAILSFIWLDGRNPSRAAHSE